MATQVKQAHADELAQLRIMLDASKAAVEFQNKNSMKVNEGQISMTGELTTLRDQLHEAKVEINGLRT